MYANLTERTPAYAAISPAERPLIVLCAGVRWSSFNMTDHHIARELNRYAQILWVDPPVSALTPKSRMNGEQRRLLPQLLDIAPNMTRLATCALPGHTRTLIERSTASLVQAQVKWALKKLGRQPYAIVACSLSGLLSDWGDDVLKVMFATDDFVAGAALMKVAHSRLLRREREHARVADLVIAISPAIAEHWKRLGTDVRVIPNGVQTDVYAGIDRRVAAFPRVKQPVAGVVGHLSARIDIALLEAVVDSGASLLLVGPYDKSWESNRFAALVKRPTVEWVGAQPFSRLPAYLAQMDVGLVPYAVSAFNDASFPLKTLEYLAAGLPVVTTDLPASRWLNTPLVQIAGSKTEFVESLHRSVKDDSSDAISARKRFAESHSWERRGRAFAEALGLAI